MNTLKITGAGAINQVNVNGQFEMYKGKPLQDVPTTYIKVGYLSHSIGNNYNSSYLTVYRNRAGVLKYEIYRDGCFWPYYGTLKQL